MRAKEIVKELMKLRGHTNKSLSEKLNYPFPSNVSQRLRGDGDMNVAILVKFLEELDCELVIRSSLKDKSEWVVSTEEKSN